MKQNQFLWFVVAVFLVLFGIFYFQKSYEGPLVPVQTPQIGSKMIASGSAEVSAQDINYFGNTKGYYAYPKVDGDYPGVVMMHEWWGLNSNIRDMARILASNGYRVLAVDLFDGKVAQNMQEAQKYVSDINEKVAITNMNSAKQFLISKKATKIGALGWCFGGGQTLQFSMASKGLSATVLYYGTPSTDSAKLKNITWPLLGFFGDQDTSIPVASVSSFKKALDDLKIINEIYIYKGVGHAFANPTGPNYAETETKDAWTKTINFLEKYLK